MADPRGLIAREVLGKRRRLRARLSFPADYELRTGQRFSQFMEELARVEEDPFGYDADHLLGALAELAAGAGDPIPEEELADAVFGDFPEILRAVNEALVATGLMKVVEEEAGEAGKKKSPSRSRSSRGRTGRKSPSGSSA
jgi:hypothetical protein